MPDLTDWDANLRQAKLILSLAKVAGVRHVVYTSSVAVDTPERFPHWDPNTTVASVLLSKQSIEAEVRESGFETWTILRPACFMANFVLPFVQMYRDLAGEGRWVTPFAEETVLPLVDTEAMGAFSCAAILEPERFHGRVVTYADELVTVGTILKKLSAATGRGLRLVTMSEQEIDAGKAKDPFVGGQLHCTGMTGFIDMESVKAYGIPLSSFETYLAREKDRVASTYLQKES
ncbi:NAD(P)-binding protein [Sodiomyces alkalinus F11]|uniref:NAD(P)-binding protein n=1 Tax=Sodiomyces alkalinus (strain CBS 110278 / VKM F-3762 / F11) TaxID=1314773 RepID=A0A3N2PZM8_SODAK|nr:NAD(P)-binding protein [Sodiomyces alkalinus F11]ROT39953.1 NAD(P)-binding protein [Sodiomyces alkalinus F11]